MSNEMRIKIQFLFKTRLKMTFHFMLKTELEDKYSDFSKIALSFQIE